MRPLRLAGPLLAFVSSFAAYGCALDLAGQPGTGGTSATSSASGLSGSVTTGVTVTSGCASSTEICDDGIDNNCDGKADCEDPQCTGPTTGRECVAPPPTGWTLVAFMPGNTATCPAGYDELAKVAEAPTSTDTHCACACDCTGLQNNPCVHGTLTGVIGNNCMAFNASLTVTGGCDAIGQKLGYYKSIKATPLGVNPIDLAGKPTLPGTQPGSSGITCTPTASKAGGCMANQACLPKAASGLCIQRPGDMACPPGPLMKRRIVGAVGSATDDQRTCDACTCTSSAASCANPTFSGYTDDSCSSPPALADVVAGMCTSSPNNTDWQDDDHFIYAAKPMGATCTLKDSAPNVNGTILPKDATTICCAE